MFHHSWPAALHPFGAAETKLASTINAYWTNLAKYGDPNENRDPGDPIWPIYNSTSELYVSLQHPVRVSAHLLRDACLFWAPRYEEFYFD